MSREHGSRVAANIRAELSRAGHRQGDLAVATNLTGSSVSERLAGKTPITVDWLFDVAEFLNVEPSRLLDQS